MGKDNERTSIIVNLLQFDLLSCVFIPTCPGTLAPLVPTHIYSSTAVRDDLLHRTVNAIVDVHDKTHRCRTVIT